MIEIEKHPLEPFLPAKAKTANAGKFSTAEKALVYGLLLPEPE